MTAREAGGPTGAMRLEELLALPAAVNVTTAGRALGIGRDKAYELLRRYHAADGQRGERPVSTCQATDIGTAPDLGDSVRD
ncbi:hypothetical protein GCM10023257_59200 [Streptomyces hyderabadensis]|uniref:Helix-turn-helix domain-containing protein n=1 Tax=Streptomyces hyderabadensis TaxID=598549 RepID=A0ABP9IPY4_9ACTN